MRGVVRAVLTAPFRVRTYREFGYLWLTVLPAAVAFLLVLVSLLVGALSLVGVGLLLLPACLGTARGVVPVFGRAGRLALGWPWRGLPPRRGALRRDRQAWGALAYLAVTFPVTVVGVYLGTVGLVVGVAAVTSPLWWFVDHDGFGAWDDLPWIGTVGLALQGAAVLLVFPWFVRLLVAIDRSVLFGLVVRDDSVRVAELETSRRVIADDAASALRRIERDLHDGTQARLVSLGMVLDRARRRVDDPAARELVDTAARLTAETLAELREIIRGVHPPALDHGLATAVATLVARSAVPAEFVDELGGAVDGPAGTTVYFAAAELLTNVAKHSGATRATVRLADTPGGVRLVVADDGHGGASSGTGSGLEGLRRRAAALDGELAVDSPVGGPTVVTVDVRRV